VKKAPGLPERPYYQGAPANAAVQDFALAKKNQKSHSKLR
jgi:hypothetical protein